MKYRTDGIFKDAPLPWRYDDKTRNVVAMDGSIVCRCGDGVYADPEIGGSIVRVFNNHFAIFKMQAVLPLLIAVARSAHSLCDDTAEENNNYVIDRADFLDLSRALDALDKLPDPPNESSTGPRKAEYWTMEAQQETW